MSTACKPNRYRDVIRHLTGDGIEVTSENCLELVDPVIEVGCLSMTPEALEELSTLKTMIMICLVEIINEAMNKGEKC